MTIRAVRIGALFGAVTAVVLAASALAFAAPTITNAGFTNPIAYDLKSLQQTRFYATVDRPVWAVLRISNGTGEVVRAYNGPVTVVGKPFWFPAWNGKTSRGCRLPSALGYTWDLTVDRGGLSSTRHGTIAVTRTLLRERGQTEVPDSRPETEIVWSRYMVAGPARVQLRAVSTSTADVSVFVQNDVDALNSSVVGHWTTVAQPPGSTALSVFTRALDPRA